MNITKKIMKNTKEINDLSKYERVFFFFVDGTNGQAYTNQEPRVNGVKNFASCEKSTKHTYT